MIPLTPSPLPGGGNFPVDFVIASSAEPEQLSKLAEQIVQKAMASGLFIYADTDMARPPHTLKTEKLVEGVAGLRILDDVGVKVHKVRGLKLHAKLLFADGVRAIVGSINLAPGSFNSRRELAIEVRDQDVVDRIHKVVHSDWENSHPMDLSDDGLLADLGEERGGKIVSKN